MKPNGDYQSDWARTVLDSYNASAEAILEGTQISQSTTAGGAITSVTYNDQAIANGSTVTENGTLAINGTNLTAQTIEVSMNGIQWQPVTSTDTKQTYTVSNNGTITIKLNGKTVMTFTVAVVTPRPFTAITFGNGSSEGEPIEDAVIDTGIAQTLTVQGTGLQSLKFSSNNPKFAITAENYTDTQATCNITASAEGEAVISLGDWVVCQVSAVQAGGGSDPDFE